MNKQFAVFEALGPLAAHVVELRHDLHRHPELGYEEHYTSALVKRELGKLGIAVIGGLAGGTGVMGIIRKGDGPVVALRADMDALPILEQTGLPWASQTPGRMHACGHDGHTAILLGAAAILRDAPFQGTIKLLFQPAEEGGCGAERMCNDGVLESPKVDAIFGLHGWPGLKVGMAATRAGALLASVDGFTVRLKGKGTHAASPQNGVDPIVAAAALVGALQAIVSREGDPTEARVLTVAQIHAGTSFNVIPDTAEINGTVRALSDGSRRSILASLERVARATAEAHRCTAAIEYFGTTPPTTNTPALAEFVGHTAAEVLGTRAFVTAPRPAMWGEDFAFYLQHVPGCFYMLGVQPEGRESYPMLHNAEYDFTDAAVPVGIRMMVELALRFLERGTQ